MPVVPVKLGVLCALACHLAAAVTVGAAVRHVAAAHRLCGGQRSEVRGSVIAEDSQNSANIVVCTNISIWTTAPRVAIHPAAGVSVRAAAVSIASLDVRGVELRRALGRVDLCEGHVLQPPQQHLLTGHGGHVAGVALRAAVLLIWAAHGLRTQQQQ